VYKWVILRSYNPNPTYPDDEIDAVLGGAAGGSYDDNGFNRNLTNYWRIGAITSEGHVIAYSNQVSNR